MKRDIRKFVGVGSMVGIANQAYRSIALVDDARIGLFLGAALGGAFLGAIAYWIAERFWPKRSNP